MWLQKQKSRALPDFLNLLLLIGTPTAKNLINYKIFILVLYNLSNLSIHKTKKSSIARLFAPSSVNQKTNQL